MQLGSIHRDERSARRAAEDLVRAGIDRACVRVVKPRASATSPVPLPAPPTKRQRALEAASGAGFGAACGALACAVLAIMRASTIAADPLGAMLAILVSTALAGAGATLIRTRDETAPRKPAVSRVRRKAWAVVVDARDPAQGAIAAAALSRSA